ncbi:MAG: bifunctional UDP-N-acetylmuramoyl-tripeptide:D-alanyl-D-alanine ligase/alanine racemase, partial [Bacteroidales bacterium]|nr:bifunctional UDP-N-acetylmuramoyl-tripeptide:D-alanyl-D-alanine ligase/alanine racemase [Bacteroidales bacterium]
MADYLVSEIAQVLGRAIIRKDVPVRNLLYDSRRINSPEDSLFLAIPGERHNGHDFINDLYTKGVRNFLLSEDRDFANSFPQANFIFINNTLEALQNLASWHRNKFNIPVVAITGSNGKTIVKEWLYHVLEAECNIVRSPKSYNSQVGVPLSLWLMCSEHNLGIFEAGISRPGEMEKLRKMILPETGIFTNIGEAHQENFAGLKHKIQEKLRLFYSCHTIIYCKDHELLHQTILEDENLRNVSLFSWSEKDDAPMRIVKTVKIHGHCTIMAISGGKKYTVEIPFSDNASVENAMHVLAFLVQSGRFSSNNAKQFSSLPPIAMRLELKKGINNCTIINDSYNSDINSLAIALDMLRVQSQHGGKTVILSDLYQTGMNEETLYKRISGLLSEKEITGFIGIGAALLRNRHLFKVPSRFFSQTGEFINGFNPASFQNEAVLIKGSRKFEFEKISSLLEEKKHRTRLEINLNALVENLNFYRSLLNENTRVMVMVKALSYGSGSYEIASVLQYQRVDYLGVAIADEGVALRNAGITLPIMVMNPEPESFDLMIRYRLEPEIYSFPLLSAFSMAVARNQEAGYPVHIKIDTGMNRLGFQENETDELKRFLKESRNIVVKSVFSHLAASDDKAHDEFTRMQISLFEKFTTVLQSMLDYTFIRHILNSSGIERFGSAQFEMVRLGIGLYGFSPLYQPKLRNVSTLKSTILQVKKVKANDTIGYGRAGKTGNNITIGIVPIGYADGLNRKLSNGSGKFLVNNKMVPVIGNICMDMCMIDLTGTDAKEGDDVIIFGDDYPMTKLAEQLGTIPYEILTGISERVKRVY